ncbi:LacI family DNA-binding transcriptional regulator [Verminephrobacter eiseniae]|uniref:Transcriptional regulator, LacI family n=1 Tax=Verminephrobacter eiseniae (strain EF01-2) TaxID=391735 RepID=A1WGG9_VEREI|nr:LacI family DNA-binding transcriptional regulator [Verminephrobacter eiseniae]ABM56726.1 transcriptional regulator, LacI family [Verminephrobacter eiseniae EF01-2]MCW5233800.1 LacI family transcriptional regulator [Verminephrobacter eiseniae]MCW5261925.1 LacI family transcriptional regulator [Verminephrobacter eiseniae]MCW5287082.1 LacI family transcriptional regulator [Verminephrobacter eiseniae]MCW5294646.1 LacI family transcriptional regulator [Verminephrobacter eiseniae]
MSRTTPTLADLAAAAGVSTMTASRALNNQPGIAQRTRAAILKVASEKGYVTNRVAQKLSSGQSGVIGVIALQLDIPFIIGVVNSVVRAAAAAGNEVLIYSHPEREKQPSSNVLQLLQQFTDGVVALPPYQPGFVEALARGRFPVAMVDSPLDHAQLPCVTADDYGGARSAMKHLAELGHKRIAFIAGSEQLGSAGERLRAYHEAVAVHGLVRDPALVVPGRYSLEGGRAAALALLALKKRPTAIFAANDLSAFGVMAVLQEQGLKIAQDMSVVGFDDVPAALHVHPALTTVRQPMEGIGRAAVSTLLSQIAGLAPDSARVTLPTELIVRQSTAPPQR